MSNESVKLNIFEGARRITNIAIGLAIICAAIFVYYNNDLQKNAHLSYYIQGNKILLVKQYSCDIYKDASMTILQKFEDKLVDVDICLKSPIDRSHKTEPSGPDPFGGHDIVVDTSNDTMDQFLTETNTPNPIDKYVNSFSLDDIGKSEIKNQYWLRLWEATEHFILYSLLGFVLIKIFSVTIGWIMRGFLQIPKGQDSRIN